MEMPWVYNMHSNNTMRSLILDCQIDCETHLKVFLEGRLLMGSWVWYTCLILHTLYWCCLLNWGRTALPSLLLVLYAACTISRLVLCGRRYKYYGYAQNNDAN